MSKSRLEGKIAIITGAASGIGEAAARLFVEHGATVVIADVQDDLGAKVSASIHPQKCSYKHCDMRDESQVKQLIDHTVKTHGRLDVMYSNAGVLGRLGSIAEMDMQEFDNVLATNARGTALAIKHASRAMIASGTRGSIICTASIAGTRGRLGPHAYTASKHAVVGLVRSAAGELGTHGIRVNCVSPSGVVTPMALGFEGMTVESAQRMYEAMAVLQGVELKAEDVGRAAVFLASEEAAYVNGHDLVVDGGITVLGPAPPRMM